MSTHPLRVDALVLAAGASARLGQPKQAVQFRGTSLLERAVELAMESVSGEVHVVVGATATHDLATLEKYDVRPHNFADWAAGQSASLRFGLGQCLNADGVLVMLVDQYRLQRDDLRRLVATWRTQPRLPAAAAYADTVGVPVVWPQARLEMLIDSGKLGRHVLDRITCNAIELEAASWDLDTASDLETLRNFERDALG